LYRASGLALLIGAVLSAVAGVLDGLLFSGNDPALAMNPLNVALSAIGVVGAACAMLGLPGFYMRSASQGGILWLVGVVLIEITGMLFGIFMGLMGAIVFPALAARAPSVLGEGPPPSFMVIFIVGTLANVLGALGLGVPILTRRLYPRWCGYLMIVAAILAAISFFVSGPGDSVLGTLLNVISPLPLFAVLGWAGYQLWMQPAPGLPEATAQVAPAAA
jgi:hypothetical protein